MAKGPLLRMQSALPWVIGESAGRHCPPCGNNHTGCGLSEAGRSMGGNET
ncbi:MAG: hypothetical protein K2H41_15545 [Acetatifactor sp.]|nr:hypothetical protein [Acetatifactor sp.]